MSAFSVSSRHSIAAALVAPGFPAASSGAPLGSGVNFANRLSDATISSAGTDQLPEQADEGRCFCTIIDDCMTRIIDVIKNCWEKISNLFFGNGQDPLTTRAPDRAPPAVTILTGVVPLQPQQPPQMLPFTDVVPRHLQQPLQMLPFTDVVPLQPQQPPQMSNDALGSSDILGSIFSFLPLEDLDPATDVCWQWRVTANRRWNSLSSKLRCTAKFGPEWWEANVDLEHYGLTVTGVRPRSQRYMIRVMNRFNALSVEGNAGFSEVTMPQGMTLNKLRMIASEPGRRHRIQFAYISEETLQAFGNVPVVAPYRFLITNALLAGSRGQSVEFQEELLVRAGCARPRLKEVVALVFLTHMSSPEGQDPTRLYNDTSSTHTHVLEQVHARHLTAGGCSPDGLNVYDNHFDRANHGTGAVWEF